MLVKTKGKDITKVKIKTVNLNAKQGLYTVSHPFFVEITCSVFTKRVFQLILEQYKVRCTRLKLAVITISAGLTKMFSEND